MKRSRLAINIRFLRLQNGWSQEKFAKKVGITHLASIRDWELRNSSPQVKFLIKMSKLFKVRLDELILGKLF